MLGKDIRFIGNNKINKAYIGNTKIFELNNTPGPSILIAGDMEAGFYGEVPASELINGENLANLVGITSGTLINNDTPWLKFNYRQKVQYISKKPIRHSLSYNNLVDLGLAYGNKTVNIKGIEYTVRLIRGANEVSQPDPTKTPPYASDYTHKSEWNTLMLPIHIKAGNKSWASAQRVESDLPYWNINYTDSDLATVSSNAGYTVVQEVWSATSNLTRGYLDASHSTAANKTDAGTAMGWRPVLEVVR